MHRWLKNESLRGWGLEQTDPPHPLSEIENFAPNFVEWLQEI